MNKSYEINFTEGKILKPLLVFSIPLILSGILQLFYNAMDIIVVGRFAGKESLAAVGSTSSLINLLTNAFMGLSIGANVLIAKGFGTNDKGLLERAVHTAVMVSIIGGIIFGAVGFVLSAPMLKLMGSPDDVLEKASLYMKIYCVGLPALALYNFGSAVLRAVGDTKRPLFFLMFSGFINVVLNLFFVIILKMDVDGVAYATVISQICSALLVVFCLMKSDSAYKLDLKKLCVCKREFFQIIRVGLPSGIQGTLFSLSNVLIQSSVNSFGSAVIAGNSAGSNIEGFVYIAMNSISSTALTFCAQNLGAGKLERVKKGFFSCILIVTAIGVVLGNLAVLFSSRLVSIYSADAEVIKVGVARMSIICSTYFLCGIMDVIAGTLRGLSYSVTPMIISLVGACGLRIVWIYTVFRIHRSLYTLYIAYPITWTMTALALFIAYILILHKLKRSVRRA